MVFNTASDWLWFDGIVTVFCPPVNFHCYFCYVVCACMCMHYVFVCVCVCVFGGGGVCVCVCVVVVVVMAVWCSGCVLGSGPEVPEFKPNSGNFPSDFPSASNQTHQSTQL